MSAATEWERCKPWIKSALEHDGGFYRIEDIEAEIAAGNATFWPGKRSAVVTQFWNFPTAKVCNHWLAGGDMSELIHDLQPVIDDWARAQGCSQMAIAGRPGWERVMAPFGFAPIFTALRKRL